MKTPNWFKVLWWIVLLVLTGLILSKRIEAISLGQTVPTDIVILLIFIALMLTPIFSEIDLFGIKLKREIENLKSDVATKLLEIKNVISSNQNQTVTNNFQGFGPPPPDTKLPEIEVEIERIVKAKLVEHGLPLNVPIAGRIDVPDDNLLMFKVRYNIENHLRRIWEQRFNNEQEYNRRHQPIMKIIQDLTKFEIIDGNFFGILREILSICNYAIHGEKVTDNQAKFVTKNAKQVIDYLSQVQ